MADPPPACRAVSHADDLMSLRIASVFVLLVASSAGALFPILAYNARSTRIPHVVFDFAKYFGSGVIVATAFIHLLAPAFHELTSPCLAAIWTEYDWAPAFAMCAVFTLFFVELFAFRLGQAKLAAAGGGAAYDVHGHAAGAHSAHGPEAHAHEDAETVSEASSQDRKVPRVSPRAQIVGIAILEFGVVFHSLLIGLTLAVDVAFKPLFVVLTLHQTFEGLGLGARLAPLQLPPAYAWTRIGAALVYGVTTPLGIALGLAARHSYEPDSATASIVSGTLDAVSAGILLYTGLVELMAHEFLFNPQMHHMSTRRLLAACGAMVLGAGIMALLGRWA